MDKTELILSYILGSTVVLEIVKAVIGWIQSKKVNLTDLAGTVLKVASAQKISMRDRIKWLAKKHIQAGEIDIDDLAILEEMYSSYHDLGGNGYIETVMTCVRSLPVKDNEGPEKGEGK